MSIYPQILQLTTMLRQLDTWLEKGAAHAKAKSFEPSVLLHARLAPDQYDLLRQIQAACDAAKFAAARVSGKEAPKHPDTEQTFEEIRERIGRCVAYLTGLSAADFEGAEARRVALPFFGEKVILGTDYMSQLAIPNFYFHVTHAYAILRHNGVDLGKRDFIAALTLLDA